MNRFFRIQKFVCCFVFVAVFGVFSGQNSLAQIRPLQLSSPTYGVRNNSDKMIDVAISTYSKQRKGSEVVGWFNVKPGEFRSFNKGDGVFLVGIYFEGKELPMQGNLGETYRWLRPGRGYSSFLKNVGAPGTGGTTNLEIQVTFVGAEPVDPRHDAPRPDQIRWNKKNDGSFEENHGNVSEDLLKRTGWRRFRLYEIPKGHNNVTVTQGMLNNAKAFSGQ